MPTQTLENEILEIEGYYVTLMMTSPGNSAMIMLSAKDRPGVWYRLFFRRDEQAPSFYPAGSGLIVNMPQSQYRPTLDLLRNETPIFLHIYGTGVTLSTSREPVGEGELNPQQSP